jgi:hypothetical protein
MTTLRSVFIIPEQLHYEFFQGPGVNKKGSVAPTEPSLSNYNRLFYNACESRIVEIFNEFTVHPCFCFQCRVTLYGLGQVFEQ